MRSLLFSASLAFTLGCSGPPAIQTAAPIEQVKEFKSLDKPKESDPAAVKLLAQMIEAHAGGPKDKLESIKTIAVERTGLQRTPVGNFVSVVWKSKIAVPDKSQTIAEYPGDGTSATCIISGDKGWLSKGGGVRSPLDAVYLQSCQAQLAEEILIYIFGFTRPGVLVQPAPSVKIGDKECLGLHVWMNSPSYLLIHIDPTTKMLVRMRYRSSESGAATDKEILITGYRESGGVKMPEKLTVAAGPSIIAEFQTLKFELDATIDPKIFEMP